MVLLIDNYDSFSYILYQFIGAVDSDIKIVRNDEITVDDIRKLNPDRVVISSGTSKPSEAGICIEVIRKFHDKIPVLGIGLGHQAIFEAFGGAISYADKLMHGKSSLVMLMEKSLLFNDIPPMIQAARYHSLVCVKDTLPDCLKITAQTETGEIMAIRHKEYPVYGLQFNPESILTPQGHKIIKNFVGGAV